MDAEQPMLVWLAAELTLMLAVAVVVRVCYQSRRRHEAARVVKAIADKDQVELLMLLVERTDFRSVVEWFGEPALTIAVKIATSDDDFAFLREVVKLLMSHGADINERGTEWRTPLMHAAAGGSRDFCALLLSYGADASMCDMFGRTAAYWAQHNGHNRTASLMRTLDT